MMIEFPCSKEECNENIIASDEKVGEMIKCPKCGQLSEVPFESLITSQPFDLADVDELSLAAPIKRPSSNIEVQPLATPQSSKPLQPQTRKPRCEKCGDVLSPTGTCANCGTSASATKKPSEKPLESIEIKLSGFQLWFCETMAQGVPLTPLKWAAHIGIGFLVLGMTLFAFLAVGGIFGFLFFLLVACGAAFYVGLVRRGQQFLTDPHAQLAWFQKPFWNGLLMMARRGDWQNYDQKLKGRKIIDLSGKAITDDNLARLDGLDTCQVLDLENTPISDQGLKFLYRLKELNCIVLRNTQVTREGVFRLQQANNKLWIWS